jgi:hypothetical protein
MLMMKVNQAMQGTIPTHISTPFQVLHPFFDSLLPLDTDARVAATHAALPAIQAVVCKGQHRQGSATCTPLHDASHRHDGAAPGQGKGAKRVSSDIGEHPLAQYHSACVWYADCRFISFHFSSVQLFSPPFRAAFFCFRPGL